MHSPPLTVDLIWIGIEQKGYINLPLFYYIFPFFIIGFYAYPAAYSSAPRHFSALVGRCCVAIKTMCVPGT